MLAVKCAETPPRANRLASKKDLFQVAPQKELDWSRTEEKSRCLGAKEHQASEIGGTVVRAT